MIFVVSSRERAFPVYLAFLSYYDVIPVLQESLCYKGMRDEDSIEMMNLVLETEVVDLTTAAGIANEQMTKICNDIAAKPPHKACVKSIATDFTEKFL